jgi:hypothetical protein
MSRFESEWKYLVVAGVITIGNVALIWSFRFLPLYDYPVWLFETKILREFFNPQFPYSTYYEFDLVPVPNLAFTAFTWLLSWIVSLETAGKLFLTLCVVGFPWSFWYCIRNLSGDPYSAAAYLGFPYSLNLFAFGGHSYLFGLILLLCILGYFLPRFERLSRLQWFFLSFSLLALYFAHAIPFAVAAVAFLSAALFSDAQRWHKVTATLAVFLLPGTAFLWYILSHPPIASSSALFDVGAIARSVLKPAFLFIKSYGISSPFSPTVLNAIWILILVIFYLQLFRRTSSGNLWDKRFILPILFSAVLTLFLRQEFSGVWQAGARFTLPLLFFLICFTRRATPLPSWRIVFLLTALTVLIYNTIHFRSVDRQLGAYYTDLTSKVDLERPFYDIKFDWPAGTSFWDQGSASVSPLFGAPYYAYLRVHGVAWIHETGILRLRNSFRDYAPQVRGGNPSEFACSVLQQIESFKFFKSVAVVGRGEKVKQVLESLEAAGFEPKLTRELWTILESSR